MANNKKTATKTATRMVMDVFLRREATTPEGAIEVSEFKDLKLPSAIISYTIGNLVNDGVVLKTGDDRFYFSQENWKKLEKKVGRIYWFLILSPLTVLIIILLLRHGPDLIKRFF